MQERNSMIKPKKELLLGGLFWILSLEFFVGQAIAQLAWSGSPYSLVNNVISDLGITVCKTVKGDYMCSPLNAVMNASFIITGVFFSDYSLHVPFGLRAERQRLDIGSWSLRA
jgi:hypothetical membrane protein